MSTKSGIVSSSFDASFTISSDVSTTTGATLAAVVVAVFSLTSSDSRFSFIKAADGPSTGVGLDELGTFFKGICDSGNVLALFNTSLPVAVLLFINPFILLLKSCTSATLAGVAPGPVSYTHLTLPTSYSV